MSERVSKDTSPASKEIWEGVRQAAKGTPEWVKPKVKAASAKMVEHIAAAQTHGGKGR
jgi:hypothetical protein